MYKTNSQTKYRFNEYRAYERGSYLLNSTYKYITNIQEGSFGKVTLAMNTKTWQKVAIKAMYKSKSSNLAMAMNEIKILSRLGTANEHICQLKDSFETSEFIIIVLEYCPNGDLYDLIHSDNNSSAIDVWSIAKELSDAIKYAHSLGIYHRDIKPENVLFSETGRVKLCDWGLATTSRSTTDFNVGTEKYMAPECFKMKSDLKCYDALSADYWSYGITLLSATFQTSPFKAIGKPPTVRNDFNFKNFVNYGNSSILFDIFPTMNENCYRIFMHLLRVGSDDDSLHEYTERNNSRDLEGFLDDLRENFKYGLTIDDEFYLEETDVQEKDSTNIFDMDNSDSSEVSSDSTKCSELFSGVDDSEEGSHLSYYKGASIGIPYSSASSRISNTVPSLAASSSSAPTAMSWCDLDDDHTRMDDVQNILTHLSIADGDYQKRIKSGMKPRIVYESNYHNTSSGALYLKNGVGSFSSLPQEANWIDF